MGSKLHFQYLIFYAFTVSVSQALLPSRDGLGVEDRPLHHNSIFTTDNATTTKQGSIWISSSEDSTDAPRFHCTGTIIGRNQLLTTTACLNRISTSNLLIGEGLTHPEGFSKVISVTRSSEFELSVLTVDDNFFSPSAVTALYEEDFSTGHACVARGRHIGLNDSQVNDASYMSHDDCSDLYDDEKVPLRDFHICSTSSTAGNNSCENGLGWSLTCDNKLVGLYSWTHFSCQLPSVYVSIEEAMPWINSLRGAANSLVGSFPVILVAMLTAVALMQS